MQTREDMLTLPQPDLYLRTFSLWSNRVTTESLCCLTRPAEVRSHCVSNMYISLCQLVNNYLVLQVLELLLDFTYSSRVIINEENAESLLEAGDMLQFHDIRDAAAEFLEKNLHASNCLGMMLLSDAHQCKRLYELSWRMCLLHYETVMTTQCSWNYVLQF